MPEAVWNGFLRLSLVSCPVHLAPATSDAHIIHLDQLNSRTGNPVSRQFVDSRTGDVVSPNAVVRGYQRAGSGYVTLADSELAALASEPPNIVEVTHFIPRNQVDRARLESSYYIYPDGQLAADTLEALRLAMQRNERDAIAHVHLGERECMVMIQLHGAGLLLSTLRPPRVLEPAEFVERPESAIPGEMVEVAEGIIARRTLGSDANMLYDRYEERLRSLIEQKSGGAPALPPRPAPPAAVVAPPPPPPPAAPAPEPEPPAAAAPPPPEPEPAAAEPPPPEPEPPAAAAPPPPEPEPAAAAPPPPEPEPAAAEPPPPEPEPPAAAEPPPPEPEPPAAAEPPPPEPEPAAAAPPPPPEPAAAAPVPEPPPARATPRPEAASPADADAARARAEREIFGSPPVPSGEQSGRELGTEILLHIMGLGDRRFVEPGWAGHPGSRRQIEAMSIRPREELEPSALEFRVFAQEGRATAWVSNGNYAGTRGRQLPLTGFAVRPATELRDRFDVVYEGCFFDGGVVGPKQNGEICTSPVANDPLEAVRISIVERSGGRAA